MNEQHEQKPPLVNNWISLFGFWLAMAFVAGEGVIIVADLIYGTHNPYIGILIYIVGPSILVFGLALVPFGMWLEWRRQLRGDVRKGLPVLDLNVMRHRFYMGVFGAATLVFLMMTSIGSYQAYHLTESTEFCGLTCHQVMAPEYTAYQHSPHARVACVQCHIGPGAEWYVKSKLTGLGQVVAVVTDSYTLPIDTPIANLRPARETCEECHWPEKFFDSIEKTKIYYSTEDDNDPYEISLLLHIGGSSDDAQHSRGIHWHIGLDHKMEYYASDEDRQVIPWVRVTYDDGRVIEYKDKNAEDFDPASIPQDQIRTMDCMDCHNRPSHKFNSPFSTVNAAMQKELIDPKLEGIKSAAVEALNGEYATQQEAEEGIAKSLEDKYSDVEDADTKAKVAQAIKQTQAIYATNFFPEQKTDWTKFPVNTGHLEFPGCFRCHDGNHVTADDTPIRQDCNLCHEITRQAEGWDAIANMEYKTQTFNHPRGFGDAWEGQNCNDCHGPGNM
ncbi:MAG: cytochrome C [bacterium]|nr:cytochrome C [bacterium]